MGQFRRVLVTGGAGFVGSHLVEALVARGHHVAVVDNFDDFYSPHIKRSNLRLVRSRGGVRLYVADIRDSNSLASIFEKEQPEVVIHLAARAGVRPSMELAKLYEEVNVGGTLNLLTQACSSHVSKFVFISSSSVYGKTVRVPFSEDQTDLRPISPYAATKLAGELLCYTYSYLYGISMTCLRLFTVYGPRQRPDLAIHRLASLLDAGMPIPIFGDGSSGRDYTYVGDVVEGILAAMQHESQFDVFNLGGSHPVKLLDLVRALEDATGKRAELQHLPEQPGDVQLTWADIKRARRLLGFEPRTPLETGLERFWSWYREAQCATPRRGEPARTVVVSPK